jgi:hypothetical protein
MREAVKYRDYARECLRQAEQAESPERREKLIELARVWTEAAIVMEPAAQGLSRSQAA